MELVWITALGVGCATVIGAIIGFGFKNISHKFSDIVLFHRLNMVGNTELL